MLLLAFDPYAGVSLIQFCNSRALARLAFQIIWSGPSGVCKWVRNSTAATAHYRKRTLNKGHRLLGARLSSLTSARQVGSTCHTLTLEYGRTKAGPQQARPTLESRQTMPVYKRMSSAARSSFGMRSQSRPLTCLRSSHAWAEMCCLPTSINCLD